MASLSATAPVTPVWTSLGCAVRHTLRSLTTVAEASAVAALDSEQARIRNSSRLWLVG